MREAAAPRWPRRRCAPGRDRPVLAADAPASSPRWSRVDGGPLRLLGAPALALRKP